MFLRHLFLATSPVLLVTFTIMGCGPTAKTGPASGAAPTPLTVAHTFEGPAGVPAGTFTAMQDLGDHLLVGTEDGVLELEYDPASGFTQKAHHDLRASPVSPCVVAKIGQGKAVDEAWIASTEGVAHWKERKFALKEESGPAKAAVPFLNAVWVARSHNLETYEPQAAKITPMPIVIPGNKETSDLAGVKKPTSLAMLDEGAIAVGTEFGLVVFRRNETGASWEHKFGPWDRIAGESIIREEGNAPLPGNVILHLRRSPDGSKLAVCTGGGLAITDPKLSQWTTYVGRHRVNKMESGKGLYHEEVDGPVPMPSSDVSDVAFGPGVLYVGTAKGLAVIPEADAGKGTVMVDIEQGLPSSRVVGVSFDAVRKLLFVATAHGLVAFKV